MSETPRSRETGGDSSTGLPQRRTGHAFAHTPHRSDGRRPQTPRGGRRPDPGGRPGTIPPVPGRPATSPPAPRLSALRLSAFCLSALSLITWQVLAAGPLLAVDEQLSRALVRTVPDAVTERLSDLGNVPVALPVLLLAMAYALWRGNGRGAAAAGLAMALVPALVVPLKEWTARPGPLEPWAAGYYPSGHTATAAVAYLGAALLVSPYVPHGRRHWPVAVALVLVGATAVGLVLRGFHWPLDVLASCFLCAPLLLAVRRARAVPERRGRVSRRSSRRSSG